MEHVPDIERTRSIAGVFWRGRPVPVRLPVADLPFETNDSRPWRPAAERKAPRPSPPGSALRFLVSQPLRRAPDVGQPDLTQTKSARALKSGSQRLASGDEL